MSFSKKNEHGEINHRKCVWGVFVVAVTLLSIWLGWRYGIACDVSVIQLKPARLDTELFAPGILDASSRTQLSPKIGGSIVALYAEPGDYVTAGTVLVRLQSDSVDALLHQAKAQLTGARAQLNAARAEWERITAAADNSGRDYHRLLDIAQKRPDMVARSDLDRSATTLAAARADESRARAQSIAAEAAVLAAESAVAYQEAQLADTVLTAPFAGVITQRIRSIGDTVGPATGILELVNPETAFIQARFDESLLAALSTNAPARVVFHQGQTADFPGNIDRIDRVVDGETRQFIAEIVLDALPPHWALGQRTDVYVRAIIQVEDVLPRHCVLWNSHGAFVWVVRNGRVNRQSVSIGLTSGDSVQIISGLNPDDRVIEPDTGLYRGQRVHPALKKAGT